MRLPTYPRSWIFLLNVRSLRLKSEEDFFTEIRRWIGLTLSVFFILIHLYAGFYGAPDSMLYRKFLWVADN